MCENSGGKLGVPPDIGFSPMGAAVASSMQLLCNQSLPLETDNSDVDMVQLYENTVVRQVTQPDMVSAEQLLSQGQEILSNSNSNPIQNNYNSQGNIEANSNIQNTQSQSGENDNTGTKTRRPVFTYSSSDSAPFSVYVEKKTADFKSTLNPIKVGGILLSEHPELDNLIQRISSIGRNRIKVEFSDHAAANRLIRSIKLIKHSLEAYIPKFHIYRKGVIRGVSQDITEGSLKLSIRPFGRDSFTVDEVKRITRKTNKMDENGESIREPTQSIIVNFKTSVLPKYVIINKVRCEVESYVQKVLICYNCYRYGHIGKQCRASSRCLKCGEQHNTEACEQAVQCLHCGGNHYAIQLNECPEFERQKRIKNTMSVNNMSYSEAAKIVPKRTYALVAQSPNRDSGSRSHQSLPLNVHNVQSTTKRTLSPTSENETAQLHKRLVTPYTMPNRPGGVLSHPSYTTTNTINSETESTREVEQFVINNILEAVKLIIQKIRESKGLNIDAAVIKNLVVNQLESSLYNRSHANA